MRKFNESEKITHIHFARDIGRSSVRAIFECCTTVVEIDLYIQHVSVPEVTVVRRTSNIKIAVKRRPLVDAKLQG